MAGPKAILDLLGFFVGFEDCELNEPAPHALELGRAVRSDMNADLRFHPSHLFLMASANANAASFSVSVTVLMVSYSFLGFQSGSEEQRHYA